MAQIQQVVIWYKGETHRANVFTLYSTGDNLMDTASFKYQLIEEIVISPQEINSQTLLIDDITISGQDYIDWDSSISANEWIYNWAANKLNLTIVNL